MGIFEILNTLCDLQRKVICGQVCNSVDMAKKFVRRILSIDFRVGREPRIFQSNLVAR